MQKVHLRALIGLQRYFASNEETRYYLNGVHCEFENGRAFFVATDGHRMGVIAWFNDELTAGASVIIPNAVAKSIKLPKRCVEGVEDVATLLSAEGGKVCLEFSNGSANTFAAIDGAFPDWRGVIPSKPDGLPAGFNWQYVADASSFGEYMGMGKGALAFNGDAPAVMTYVNSDRLEAFSLIMPHRGGLTSEWAPPAWLSSTAGERIQEAA